MVSAAPYMIVDRYHFTMRHLALVTRPSVVGPLAKPSDIAPRWPIAFGADEAPAGFDTFILNDILYDGKQNWVQRAPSAAPALTEVLFANLEE